MTRQERQIGGIVLAMIALSAVAIHFTRPFMGKPGLALERGVLTNQTGKVVRETRVHLPERVPGFKSQDSYIADIEISALPEDTTFGRKLYWDNDGFIAQMSAVMMKTDRTSIHRPQTCITGQGWKIARNETIDIPMASPIPYILKATCLTSSKELRDEKGNVVLDSSGKPRIVSSVYIYWMVSEKKLAPSQPEALWAITQDLITTGTLYPWAYVSCFSRCNPGEEAALQARMKRLISGATPQFQLYPRGEKQTAFLSEPQSVN